MLFRLPRPERPRAHAHACRRSAPSADARGYAARYARLSPGSARSSTRSLAMKALHRRPDVAMRRAELHPACAADAERPALRAPVALPADQPARGVGSHHRQRECRGGGDRHGRAVRATRTSQGQLAAPRLRLHRRARRTRSTATASTTIAKDPGDGGGVQPSSFHGTHVAGTIGANDGQRERRRRRGLGRDAHPAARARPVRLRHELRHPPGRPLRRGTAERLGHVAHRRRDQPEPRRHRLQPGGAERLRAGAERGRDRGRRGREQQLEPALLSRRPTTAWSP